jgi:hypothetical protein
MSWAKFSDDFWCHPKVVGLSDRAFRLHVTAICWSAALETDGAVPRAMLAVLRGTPAAARELEAAGLWEQTAGGWCIHDFLEYNPSRSDLEERRERRSAANRENARRRWQQDASGSHADADATSDANSHATSHAAGIQVASSSHRVSHDHVHAPDPTRTRRAAAPDSLRSSAAAAEAAAAAAGCEPAANSQPPGEPAAPSEPADPLPLLLRHWERATGTTVTPMLADWLDAELGQGTPEDWLRDAIAETGANGVKAWKYTRSIVERWKAQGRDSPPAPAAASNRPRQQEVTRGETRQRAERAWADDPVLAEWRALGILAE